MADEPVVCTLLVYPVFHLSCVRAPAGHTGFRACGLKQDERTEAEAGPVVVTSAAQQAVQQQAARPPLLRAVCILQAMCTVQYRPLLTDVLSHIYVYCHHEIQRAKSNFKTRNLLT